MSNVNKGGNCQNFDAETERKEKSEQKNFTPKKKTSKKINGVINRVEQENVVFSYLLI